MTVDHDLGRRVADQFADEVPTRAPDWLLASILDATETTRQRHAHARLPWRFHDMQNSAKLAIAAVVVVVVGALGVLAFRPGDLGVGGHPSPVPTSSGSTGSTGPALTETFTSDMHGVSVMYPAGWIATRATNPWTSNVPDAEDGQPDRIEQNTSDAMFIGLASQPFDGRAGADWANELIAEPEFGGTCPPTILPLTIDGAPGRIAMICGEGLLTAQAWTGGRGYWFVLYRSDDVDWFREILATVRLDPAAALDAPPSPAPTP